MRELHLTEGVGVCEVARTFDVHRNTASKYLKDIDHEYDAMVAPAAALSGGDVRWTQALADLDPDHVRYIVNMLRVTRCTRCGEQAVYLTGMSRVRCSGCGRSGGR